MTTNIGIMSFAHLHAESYAIALNAQLDACLSGIADIAADRAKVMGERYHARVFSDYASLLASDVQGVVITAENVRHRELVEMAAAAGKHILCEKPLATTPDDARKMVAACDSAGVQLMTAFPCRFSPAMQRIKKARDNGELGEVLAVRGTNRGSCPYGWFTDKSLSGGGALIDHTVHVTDLLRWLLGREVTEVYAETSNGMNHQNYEDVVFLTMEFEDGIFATLDSSWSRCKSYPTWGDVTLAVVGDKGVMNLDMFAQNLIHYSDRSGKTAWKHWGKNIDMEMMKAFVHTVKTGEKPPISGIDGLRAVEVVQAAYRSVEAGEPIKVEVSTI